MNSNAKQRGIKVHNALAGFFKKAGSGIATGARVAGRGIKTGALKTYENALTPAGHFVAGVVIGERDIAKEQAEIAGERLADYAAGGIDPDSKLMESLRKTAEGQ